MAGQTRNERYRAERILTNTAKIEQALAEAERQIIPQRPATYRRKL